MPDANTLTISIFATLVQHERERISSCTRSALWEKIAQGAKLGKPENLTADARAKGSAATMAAAKANNNNRWAMLLAQSLQGAGKNLGQIADQLNGAGFRTARVCQFKATQIMRLLKHQP